MYALSNLVDGEEPSFRSVTEDTTLTYDEVISHDIQRGQVWDADTQSLRFPNNAEKHAAAVAEQVQQIDADRDQKLGAGVSYTFPDGTDGTIQTRSPLDLVNVLGLVTQAQVMQAGGSTGVLEFRDAENVTHTLTPAEVLDMGDVVTAATTSIYKQSWDAKDALRSSS